MPLISCIIGRIHVCKAPYVMYDAGYWSMAACQTQHLWEVNGCWSAWHDNVLPSIVIFQIEPWTTFKCWQKKKQKKNCITWCLLLWFTSLAERGWCHLYYIANALKWLCLSVKDVLHRYPRGARKQWCRYISLFIWLGHANPGENRMNSKAVRAASAKHKY